jgi:hypothetical protein
MVKKYIDAGIELTKFLNAAKNLAKQGIKKNEVLAFAKQQFGEITDSLRKQVDDIFEKSPLAKILDRRKAAKKSVEERKVLDMEGNVIDVNKPIIGGKQTKMETSDLDDILSGVDDVDISQGMIDLDELNFTKNAMAAKKAIDEAPTPGFNVEKFIEDFPVSREEAVRISKLPQKERAVILQKYIDNDMKQQIELMDFEPPKDRDPNAMGGRIGYKDGTENMMAEIDYSSSAYRMQLIDSLMDTGGLDYGSAVKEADRIIEIKLRPKTKKKLAAGGLPNILGY